jgi:hypothetical protein
MYEQPYTINKITRTGASFAGCFAKLGKQFPKCGELHTPVPFFKFIPEVARRLQSRDMNAYVGGQVPEDRVVGLGFAARPFTVALERLDLHFEARFNGSLPHRPNKVRFHQGWISAEMGLAYLNRQSGRSRSPDTTSQTCLALR